MSRKHRAASPRWSGFVWLAFTTGAVLLLLAAFFFLRQAGPPGTGTPQIAVDQQKIDYGYVKLGEPRSFKIVVTNTGDGVLRFKRATLCRSPGGLLTTRLDHRFDGPTARREHNHGIDGYS